MKFVLFALSFFILGLQTMSGQPTETLTFPSQDGLEITADLYHLDDKKPIILLLHQAGSSRGEYKEIAPRLNKLGFNCMAIDQRSGKESNEVVNETAKRAMEKQLPVEYADALPDIQAAIQYLKNKYKREVIVWGSSYSASLALWIAPDLIGTVITVIAFSPGDYLGKDYDLEKKLKEYERPVFLTSTKKESDTVKKYFDVVWSMLKIQFIPSGEGTHGSRALWSASEGNAEYWESLEEFLSYINQP